MSKEVFDALRSAVEGIPISELVPNEKDGNYVPISLSLETGETIDYLASKLGVPANEMAAWLILEGIQPGFIDEQLADRPLPANDCTESDIWAETERQVEEAGDANE